MSSTYEAVTPQQGREFLRRRTFEVLLADNTRVRVRPIAPDDKARLLDGWERLSPESRYRRFMGGITRLTPSILAYLTEVDYADHFAWIAVLDEPAEPGVGVARYVRLPAEPTVAEAAVTVVDEYQGRGLGTLLLEALASAALENGISTFRAYVLAENHPMLDVLRSMGAKTRFDSPGMLRADVDLPGQAAVHRHDALHSILRAAARGEICPCCPPALAGLDAASNGDDLPADGSLPRKNAVRPGPAHYKA